MPQRLHTPRRDNAEPKVRGQRLTVTSTDNKRHADSRRTPSRRQRGFLGHLFIWSLVISVWAGVALAGLAAWYALTLPEVGAIEQMTRRPNVTLTTSDGVRLSSFGGVYGETLELAEMPPSLPRAVIAVEDRRFYAHGGVDFRGLARAMYTNLRQGRIVQGGSTLTQQLAKNLFLTPDRTIRRKFQELILALWLEAKFDKDQILTIYLNRVYLGAGAYGVDAAARRYFGKSARDVTLYESALLAGLLKAPSRLNPANSSNEAGERAELVLRTMVSTGMVTQEEAVQALQQPTVVAAGSDSLAPYFADWIMAQVSEYLGGIDRDIVVTTTLDPEVQQVAEAELIALLEADGAERQVSQAALVSLESTGAVRAMVGGMDYRTSQFNRATQALRQPGSAFKPFVYISGFERAALTPDAKVVDAPVNIAGWQPKNYGDRYYGEVTLRESFARSLNSVAVRITQQVGPQTVADVARRLGISTPLDVNGSIALGSSEVTLLDLSSAYGVFANQGYPVFAYGIEEIRDLNGEVLYRRSPPGERVRVVAPLDVDRMNNLMTAVVEWGTGKSGKLDRPAAGKTGTSQEFGDAWFVGFTAELVTGVWLGNDDNTPMKGVTGGNLPVQLWARVMTRALAERPPQPLPGGGPVTIAESAGSFISRILRGLTQAGESADSSSDAAGNWNPADDPTFNRDMR